MNAAFEKRKVPSIELCSGEGQVAAIAELIKGDRIVIRSVQIGAGSKMCPVAPRYEGVLIELLGSKASDGSVKWQAATTGSNEKLTDCPDLMDESGWCFKELPKVPDTVLQKQKAEEVNKFFEVETVRLMDKDEFFSYRENPYKKRAERTTVREAEIRKEPVGAKKERVVRMVQTPRLAVPALAAGMQQLELITKLSEALNPIGIKVSMDLAGEPVVDCGGLMRSLNVILKPHGVRLTVAKNGIPVAVPVGVRQGQAAFAGRS